MTNHMWGGRFSQEPNEIMEEINASIEFDQELYRHDIMGSKTHVSMLARQNIISQEDAQSIDQGLDTILAEIENGTFKFSRSLEDIHMNIESRLAELIGPVAGKLHTARSRNDQVATDFKLWVRDTVDQLAEQLRELQIELATKAEKHASVIMPGFTHLQTAQPVTFGHHLLAYVEMLERDRGRFQSARERLNESPLGSGALAGTSFPIDRDYTALELGFKRPTANSIDAVSDRDFVMEVLAVAAICATHLSRFGEEIVLWCSSQFNFIELPDTFTTGSSIMPQKRNPDAAELVRAKTGRIFGALNAILVVMKGLPLAYSKDMQEDKEQTFDALKNFSLVIAAMTGMVKDLKPNDPELLKAASLGYSTATDLADWCVRVLGLPFREAHQITGQIVAMAEKQGKDLHQISLEDLQGVDARFTEDVYSVLSVESSVSSRTSYGGTAPDSVTMQAKQWLKTLAKEKS